MFEGLKALQYKLFWWICKLSISSITKLASLMRITPRLKALPMVVLLFSLSLLVEKELKATRVSIVNKPLWYSTFGFVLHEEMGLLSKALLKKKVNNNVKLLNSKKLLEVIFYPFFYSTNNFSCAQSISHHTLHYYYKCQSTNVWCVSGR
jgi:hypothetical protein